MSKSDPDAHLNYIKSVTSLKSHAVPDVKKLKQGDHLYVKMPNTFGFGSKDHGIVYFVPEDLQTDKEAYNEIIIIDMNRKGVRKVSLHKFCYKGTEIPRYVVYGVSQFYKEFSDSDICYTEKPLDVNLIIERCDYLLKELSYVNINNKDGLKDDLSKCNSQDFAILCTLPITTGNLSREMIWLYKKHEIISKIVGKAIHQIIHMVKYHQSIKDLVHNIKDSFKHNPSTVTNQLGNSTGTLAGDTAKAVLKSTAIGVGVTAGIAGGVEVLMDIGRVLHYKNDIEYTKDDLKMDILKGGSTTAVVLGTFATITFCVSNPVGWAIGGSIVAGAILAGLWHLYQKKFGKSWKQKMYRQFSDKNEFKNKQDFKNIKKLIKLRRKLNKYIIKYKLHPDRWTDEDREEMKKHEEWLNDPTWYKRWWHKLQDNLSCTLKNQEELIQSYKTKEQKLKVFFLFQAIKTQIDKDINDIKNGTYDEENDKKNKKNENKKPLAIEC